MRSRWNHAGRSATSECFLLTALLTTLSETDNYSFRRTSVPRVAIHTSQAHLVRKYQIVMREKGRGGFCPATFQIFFFTLGLSLSSYFIRQIPHHKKDKGMVKLNSGFWISVFPSYQLVTKVIRKKTSSCTKTSIQHQK